MSETESKLKHQKKWYILWKWHIVFSVITTIIIIILIVVITGNTQQESSVDVQTNPVTANGNNYSVSCITHNGVKTCNNNQLGNMQTNKTTTSGNNYSESCITYNGVKTCDY